MPALILFNRKWLIACDDLVIPYITEASLRLIWLTAASAVTLNNIYNCNESMYIKVFMYTATGNLLLSICLCIILSIISAKGSVLEVDKRKSLPAFLYLKLTADLIDFTLIVFGIWIFLTKESNCKEEGAFLKAYIVISLIYTLGLIFGMLVFYNSLGSSKYWNSSESNGKSLKFFRKAENIWKFRLKFLCCCANMNEDNDFMYVEISTFLASFLNGVDFVPSDILAGILTLREKHALERRKKSVFLNSLSNSNALLENKPIPDWMSSTNALYFLRTAKSTYGWLVFFDAFRPWNLCSLLSHAKCCVNCFNQNSQKKTGDCCCYCNSAALQKITGFSDSDLLYASFSNSIYEPAFFIALDHGKRCIIIAIRGTRSFSDLVTDIDGEEETFPSEYASSKFKCHRGVLRSAIYVHKKIKDLNILNITAAENPSYTLVLTGHSLGGSIAAVLSLFLRIEFPKLQCYAYAPLAALSYEGISETLDSVFSIVIGDDMIPRLCLNSCKELRVHLLESLAETKIPKYKILTRAAVNYIKKNFNLEQKKHIIEGYENKVIDIDDEICDTQSASNSVSKQSKLYAPGRILYLKKIYKYESLWITGLSLQHIIISSRMIMDHQPHQIHTMLEMHAKQSSENLDVCTRL